jgi:hypothetical protein
MSGGEVGGRLDPGVGEHRDDRRVDDVAQARVAEEVDLLGQPVGVHDDDRADHDHRQLQAEVGERYEGEAALAAAAGDVEDVEDAGADDHHRGDHEFGAAVVEARPDRHQVVRHADRRQGDHDQVVEQDRPAGDEGDQLVEGVAGEGGGAAALAEHRAALDVGERRQPEEEPGDEEDQRGEPEAFLRHHPEGEVDREADRRVGGGEEPGHAQAAAQFALAGGVGGLHRSCLLAIQKRPTPTATKRMPIRKPIDAGPPPLTRVTTRSSTPITTKASEKPLIAPW